MIHIVIGALMMFGFILLVSRARRMGLTAIMIALIFRIPESLAMRSSVFFPGSSVRIFFSLSWVLSLLPLCSSGDRGAVISAPSGLSPISFA